MRPACRCQRRGAVLAEFVMAFPVLLTAYFCFLQMAQVYAASLVMRHATVVLARYASVALPSDFIPDEEDRSREGGETSASWREVAEEALGPWKDVVKVKGTTVEAQDRSDPWGDVEAKVDFEYACHVPIAKYIVCLDGRKQRTVRVTTSLNGAKYAFEPERQER